MPQRRETVGHPFGTIKSWMGSTHFQMKTLKRVATEMAPYVLAYNLKRAMSLKRRLSVRVDGPGAAQKQNDPRSVAKRIPRPGPAMPPPVTFTKPAETLA